MRRRPKPNPKPKLRQPTIVATPVAEPAIIAELPATKVVPAIAKSAARLLVDLDWRIVAGRRRRGRMAAICFAVGLRLRVGRIARSAARASNLRPRLLRPFALQSFGEEALDDIRKRAILFLRDRCELGVQIRRQPQADLLRWSDVSGHGGNIIFQPPLDHPGCQT